MAPNSARRSSSSRRAQYSVFTGYVLATIGAVVGAVFLGLSLISPEAFSGPREVANDVASPAGEVSARARTDGKGLLDSISGYLRAGSQNAQLKKEVELARIRLAEAKATEAENARLKALLGLTEAEVKPVVVTRLIASTSTSARRFGYIGAGRADGVKLGMPVRSERGVIGRVLEVGSATSRVLLLTDSQSVLPVQLASTKRRASAFAEGRGDGRIQIRLINLGINPLRKGDVLVTSGAGGYYRPGIAVAIVSEVTGDGAIARPISDPAATNYVSVEPVWQPEAIAAAATPVEESIAE